MIPWSYAYLIYFRPDDSTLQTHEILSGDFLVISTDGLFDNLYEDEIALIINEHINNKLIQNSLDLTDVKQSSYLDYEINEDCLNKEKANNELVNCSKKVHKNSNFKNEINNNLLETACDVLIQKASDGILNYYFLNFLNQTLKFIYINKLESNEMTC